MQEHNLERQAAQILRHPSGSIDAVFLARALRALESLVQGLSKDALTAAVAASTDLGAVLTAILAARRLEVDEEEDPLVRARLRGQEARFTLLSQEGGTLSAVQAAELLGISRQAINKRRQTGKLLALPVGGRQGYAYPAWQFAGNRVLPGFTATLAQLSHVDPWMQARFFLNHNPRLDGSRPLDELRRGGVEAALRAARAYGEHGAA